MKSEPTLNEKEDLSKLEESSEKPKESSDSKTMENKTGKGKNKNRKKMQPSGYAKIPEQKLMTDMKTEDLSSKKDPDPVKTEIPNETRTSATEVENVKKIAMEEALKGGNDLTVNESYYIADYSFSFNHYFCTSNEAISSSFRKYDYQSSPNGEYSFIWSMDLYSGSITSRIDFWSKRLMMAADLYIAAMKVLMKVKTTYVERYNGHTHVYDAAYQPISEDKMRDLFVTNLKAQQVNHNAIVSFYNVQEDHLIKLQGSKMGTDAVMNFSSIRNYWNQREFTQLNLPSINSWFSNLMDIYETIKPYNISGKMFVMQFDAGSIKNEKQLGFMMKPKSGSDIVLTYIATRVMDFKTQMFKIVRSICDDLVTVSAAGSKQSQATVAASMNLVVTSVGKINGLPSEVFSTNATLVFNTMVAGCCMNEMFAFEMEINPASSIDLSVIFAILSYLMYTPRPLLHNSSIALMKSYLYKNLLGAYAYSNRVEKHGDNRNRQTTRTEVPCKQFSPSEFSRVEHGAPFDGTPGGEKMFKIGYALNQFGTTWDSFVADGNNSGLIYDFFNYPFSQVDTVVGDNILFEGATMMHRFTLCINLLLAVTAFPIYQSAITNTAKGNMIGFIDVLINQCIAYTQYTLYLTNVVNIIMSLGLTEFSTNTTRLPLSLGSNQLISLTATLNFFQADFKMQFHKVKIWSEVVKTELQILVSLFRYYWGNDSGSGEQQINYWSSVKVMPSRAMLSRFLEPIVGKFKFLFTTNIAKWVYDNLWGVMERVDDLATNAAMKNFDILDFRVKLKEYDDLVRYREFECGYLPNVVYKSISSDEDELAGLQYVLTAGVILGADVISRANFSNNFNALPICVIASSDALNYPCFRIKPTFRTGLTNNIVDDTGLIQDVRDLNKVIDIPLYIRYVAGSGLYNDPILDRPPLFLPPINPSFRPLEATDITGDGTTTTFINHDIDEILFKSSNDIDTFFSLKAIL